MILETTLQPEGQHEEMLTINQAAEFLNVKISKLRKEVFYGRIKHYNLMKVDAGYQMLDAGCSMPG